jgi:hypothetical protein
VGDDQIAAADWAVRDVFAFLGVFPIHASR